MVTLPPSSCVAKIGTGCCAKCNHYVSSNFSLPFLDVFMIVAYLTASLCVLTRAILNVCDRQIFKQENVDFLKSIVYNAVFPFVVSLVISLCFCKSWSSMYSLIVQPGIFFSALGAQLAAYLFSLGFKSMTVKSVAVTAKTADFFIPLIIFAMTNRFQYSEYVFACLSTLIFLPLLRGQTHSFTLGIAIVLILLLQVMVNTYFHMNSFADTWPKFLAMMTSILFWRILFTLPPLLFKKIKTMKNNPIEKKRVPYHLLALRALLAFVSQSAFFYSITGVSTHIAWPILNSTTLVACYTAHLLLGEQIGKTEVKVLGSFICLSIIYLFIQGKIL